MLGGQAECRDKAEREWGGSTLLRRLKVCSELKKGKGKLLRWGLVASWKAFTSILVAKTLRHISCLLQGIFFFSFSLDRFLPKFLFISFRWKDQIRSSVKIARQRFACQGISFCYLYWNIIRFRHSHIFISNSFSISISISISISLVLFSTKRERESDSFSIRFDSNRFRCDFGAWQNSTYASFNFMFPANPQHTQKWHTHSHTLTHANIESHTCTHSSHSGLSS